MALGIYNEDHWPYIYVYRNKPRNKTMATYNVKLNEMSGNFEAASKRDAALAAMKVWGKAGAFEVIKAVAGQKLVTARKEYTCDCCKKPIFKGHGYAKKNRSIGNPSKTTFDGVGITHHGIRYSVQICANCAS